MQCGGFENFGNDYLEILQSALACTALRTARAAVVDTDLMLKVSHAARQKGRFSRA